MEDVGIGLIGCGNIALIHTASLARIAAGGVPIRPVAASDPSPEARVRVAENWAFERLHAHSSDVLEDPEVDAVYVCTPTALHRDLYLAALGAGKHLYAEKPIAPDFPTVVEVCEAAMSASVISQVGFQQRFHALLREARRLVLSGELGPPMAYVYRDDEIFPTTDLNPYSSDWRSDARQAGGGTLLEHTIHGIDILAWIFGPVGTVAAATRNLLGFGVEDTAAVLMEHESGVTGTVVSVFHGVMGREASRLEIHCRDGVIETTWGVLVEGPELSFRLQRPGELPVDISPVDILDTQLADDGLGERPWFWNELAARAFVEAVRSRRPASPDFGDALLAHATVEAAYRSVSSGRPTSVVEVAAGRIGEGKETR